MEQITTIKNGVGIVNLFGAWDRIQDSIVIQNKVKELSEQPVTHIILDLSEVVFITASFCGYLIGIAKRMKEIGIRFSIIIDESSKVFGIFDIIGLLSKQEIVGIYSSLHACFSIGKMQNQEPYQMAN